MLARSLRPTGTISLAVARLFSALGTHLVKVCLHRGFLFIAQLAIFVSVIFFEHSLLKLGFAVGFQRFLLGSVKSAILIGIVFLHEFRIHMGTGTSAGTTFFLLRAGGRRILRAAALGARLGS